MQHPVYMEQLKVRSFEVQAPDNETAMLRYRDPVPLPASEEDWPSGSWISSAEKPLKSLSRNRSGWQK